MTFDLVKVYTFEGLDINNSSLPMLNSHKAIGKNEMQAKENLFELPELQEEHERMRQQNEPIFALHS